MLGCRSGAPAHPCCSHAVRVRAERVPFSTCLIETACPLLPARGIQKIVTARSGTASCEAIGCRVLNALRFPFVVYGVACFAPSAHGLKDDFHRGRSCLSELHIAA